MMLGMSLACASEENSETPLIGISWTMVSLSDSEQAVISVLADTTITATFGDDGQLTGSAGCNGYFTSFELDGETISFGPTGATRRFCTEPEGVMDQEMLFLSALGNASKFQLTGDRLDLRDDTDSLLVTFVVVED